MTPANRFGAAAWASDPHGISERFDAAERDAAALHVAARAAREFLSQTPTAYQRLSDLLDEWLPVDRAVQDGIARAVCMPPTELDALRRSRVDPLMVSLHPLVSLAEAFGVSGEQLRSLVRADHERFADVRATARGKEADTGWDAFDATLARMTAENPSRFTD